MALAEQCLVCSLPLSGMLGGAVSMLGIGRSPRNPNFCTRCNTHLEEGRLVELTMLFADLTSFTELTNRLGAERTYDVVDRYLRFASGILTSHGAFIDKYVGDSVMAFFNVPAKTPDHPRAAVAAALELQTRLPELAKELGMTLQATVGIATGFARVGRLGSGDVKDYTAIGEVVNQAARLQAQARPGEVLVSEKVYVPVAAEHPGVPPESLTLKGFRDATTAYRLRAAPGARAPQIVPAAGKSIGLGGLISALLGAGCLGVPLVSLAATSLGLGAAPILVAGARWLDRGPLHLPFVLAAAAAAVMSLAALRREHQAREACRARGSCIEITPREKLHNMAAAMLSLFTLLFVAAEVVLHHMHFNRFH